MGYKMEENQKTNWLIVNYMCKFKLSTDIYVTQTTTSKWFGLYTETKDIIHHEEAIYDENINNLVLYYFRYVSIKAFIEMK